MKTSLQWLSEFLPGPLDADKCAGALTHGGLPVENIERLTGDSVLDVEVTSNRADCLSHVGVARELSALLGRDLLIAAGGSPRTGGGQAGVAESAALAASVASVRIDAADLCPHYTARIIRGIKIAPSPAWLQQRLQAVGLRPINNVVDVTNYVLFELGQPLHAFDFDKLEGRQIIVRRAAAGEKLLTIDGKVATLTPDMLTIADAARPVALAGVMGGKESEVHDGTTTILLESARFDALSVRKTSRALTLRSDSSYRFERGIDPTLPVRASLRAVQLILNLAGGELLGGIIEAGADGYKPRTLTLRLPRIKHVLGIEFPVAEVMTALTRLRLQPVRQGDEISVTVPSDRLDVNIEADLIEEVARVIGYDRIPIRDEISIRLAPAEPTGKVIETIRSTLIASGFFESINFGWVSDSLAGDFVPPEANPGNPLPRVDASVRADNAHLRPSILPGLLEGIRRNENAGTRDPRLFEIGSIFWNDTAGKAVERRSLGLVGSADYRVMRGAVETVLNHLAPGRAVHVAPFDHPGYARGACGRVEWGGQPVGYVGRIDRKIAEKMSLREPPAAAELVLPALLSGAMLVPTLSPLPKFPSIERDLSLVIAEAVRYEQIQAVVSRVAPKWLESVDYVTTYRGKPLEKGAKSVTVKLVFRSPTETLTSEQVEASVAQVVESAKAELGATLRV